MQASIVFVFEETITLFSASPPLASTLVSPLGHSRNRFASNVDFCSFSPYSLVCFLAPFSTAPLLRGKNLAGEKRKNEHEDAPQTPSPPEPPSLHVSACANEETRRRGETFAMPLTRIGASSPTH